MKNNILVPIYHPRDYYFYKEISKKIKTHNFFFLTFYYLKDSKTSNIINFYNYKLKKKILKKINKKLLFHEKLSFQKDINFLKKKYSFYFSKNIEILKEYKIDFVIQELGGFICHLSIYHAAKELKINHYFIEPTPLKKNCFFLKNSMRQEGAISVNNKQVTFKKKKQYILSLKNKKYLAINNKDLHLKKKNMLHQIFSMQTIIPLVKKIKDILIFNHSEFSNLKFHIKDYLIRVKNSIINLKVKKIDLNNAFNFIYYPLHVPLDFALTHRAIEKIDQISNLKKIIPSGSKLILKEHPLVFSKYDYSMIKKKLINLKVDFFDKNLSSLEISKKAKCALTINSKSGLEFLCINKPVFSIIKNYYTRRGLAIYVKNKKIFLKYLLNLKNYKPKKKEINNLLNQIFSRSIFFDLYNLEKTSLIKSINSIKHLINKKILI